MTKYLSRTLTHHLFVPVIHFRYNQKGLVKTLTVLEQMTYDLMGVEKNAYGSNFGGMNEEAVLDFSIKHNVAAMARTIYQKIRYVKYMCGDMDEAAKYYDLYQGMISISKNTGECI